MAESGTIGIFTETSEQDVPDRSQASFKWELEIRDLLNVNRNVNGQPIHPNPIKSPPIWFCNEKWFLKISRSLVGCNVCSFCLERAFSGGANHISCSLSIKDENDVIEISVKRYFSETKEQYHVLSINSTKLFDESVPTKDPVTIVGSIQSIDAPEGQVAASRVRQFKKNSLSLDISLEEIQGHQSSHMKEGIKPLLKNLEEFYLSGHHADAQIKIGNQTFKVHKVVLAAQSTVFHAMFQHPSMTENTDGIINIDDCAEETFNNFLLFLYTGDCENLQSKDAISLYKTAEKYNVDELRLQCRSCLEIDVSVDIVLDAILLADLYDETKIMERAIEVFLQSADEILATEKWDNFMMENRCLAKKLMLKIVKLNQDLNTLISASK